MWFEKGAATKALRQPPPVSSSIGRGTVIWYWRGAVAGCKMVTSWIQPIQLGIYYIRKPGQRNPVGTCFKKGKSPANASQTQPLIDIWVINHIEGIIKIDKLVVLHLPKQEQHGAHQDDTDGSFQIACFQYLAALRRFLHSRLGHAQDPDRKRDGPKTDPP